MCEKRKKGKKNYITNPYFIKCQINWRQSFIDHFEALSQALRTLQIIDAQRIEQHTVKRINGWMKERQTITSRTYFISESICPQVQYRYGIVISQHVCNKFCTSGSYLQEFFFLITSLKMGEKKKKLKRRRLVTVELPDTNQA